MSRSLRGLAVLAIGVFATGGVSRGAVLSYYADLSGPAESPPNASPATGTAQVDVDTTAHTMHIHVDFTGLLGTTTASHIHSPTPAPGVLTAGVATMTPSFSGFPLGVTAGTFDNTYDLTLASSFNGSFVTANGGTPAGAEAALLSSFAAGTAYLNIHTSAFPGGEIRGFLPEPTTGLIGLLGAGLMAVRRRRSLNA